MELTGLARKLGVKPGDRICLVDAPPDTAAALQAAFPPGVIVLDEVGNQRCELLFFWPRALADLARRLETMQLHIRPEGAIWVVMPKKKYAQTRGVEFTWEEMQAAGLQTDLVDNKVAAISEQEYGTRFVIRKERRRKYGA